MIQPQEPALPNPFRLGEWEVRRDEGLLCAGDQSVRLEPRVMDVLVHLAANPERVVSKEELLTVVWGGAFVEEGALAQAIHSLRKALGDDARQPRFIQTVPKRGYRLVAQRATVAARLESGLRHELASTRAPNRRFLISLAGLVLVVCGVLIGWGRWGHESHPPMLVVLPFENIGPRDGSFFADGLAEEITKDLYSLHSLRVISRASALLYGGDRKPLPEIARELGVDYVLEGTVRWQKGTQRSKVRINLRLIRVADNVYVWADSFDRKVEDIFEVQAEISQKVLRALDITLLPEDVRKPQGPPTENLDAYRAYLRGLQLKNQPFYSKEYLLKAATMFERAVELDPRFASAWAELSQIHSYLAFNNEGSLDEVAQSRRALGKAMALAPAQSDVRVSQAYFTYRCLGDFDAAYQELSTAARLFPNDAGVLQSLGYLLRRRGRPEEAVQILKRASDLNPRSSETLWGIGETYRALRDYRQADIYFGSAISLAPDEPYFWEERVLNWLAWKGTVEEARAILDQAPITSSPKLAATAFKLDMYDRKYEQALSRFSRKQVRELPAPDPSRIAMLGVLARERLGDHRGALEAARANYAELQARLAVFPKEALTRAYMALALAQLGREAEAIAEAKQAVLLKKKDAFTGPPILQVYAMVEVTLGNRREAVDLLKQLLATSYRSAISPAELRLDPVWDSLRGDPAFEKLLQESER